MDRESQLTLAQVLQLLRDFGFIPKSGKKGVIVYSHDDSGAVFLFRERELDSPALMTELVNLRKQLTYRGFMTDEEFDRFLSEPPVPAPQE